MQSKKESRQRWLQLREGRLDFGQTRRIKEYGSQYDWQVGREMRICMKGGNEEQFLCMYLKKEEAEKDGEKEKKKEV